MLAILKIETFTKMKERLYPTMMKMREILTMSSTMYVQLSDRVLTSTCLIKNMTMQGTGIKEDEDEEDNFDYEDRVFAVMKARGKHLDFHESANFDHEDPGLQEVCYFVYLSTWYVLI